MPPPGSRDAVVERGSGGLDRGADRAAGRSTSSGDQGRPSARCSSRVSSPASARPTQSAVCARRISSRVAARASCTSKPRSSAHARAAARTCPAGSGALRQRIGEPVVGVASAGVSVNPGRPSLPSATSAWPVMYAGVVREQEAGQLPASSAEPMRPSGTRRGTSSRNARAAEALHAGVLKGVSIQPGQSALTRFPRPLCRARPGARAPTQRPWSPHTAPFAAPRAARNWMQ